MPLKVLFTGRSTREQATTANGHLITFRDRATVGPTAVDVGEFDAVFLHMRNPEANKALDQWVRIGASSKLILFGGTAVDPGWSSHGLPTLGNVAEPVDLPWSNVPRDFRGSADDLLQLLVPRNLDLLPALCILCQGYLAATSGDAREDDVSRALDAMAWPAFEREPSGHQTIATARGRCDVVQTARWWTTALSLPQAPESVRRLRELVEAEWDEPRHGPLPEDLTSLLDAFQADERIAQARVARVYLAISARLR